MSPILYVFKIDTFEISTTFFQSSALKTDDKTFIAGRTSLLIVYYCSR